MAGQGDVSAASESSLNPSQFLSGNTGSLTSAQERGREARARSGESRDQVPDGSTESGAAIDLGPFSLLLNGRSISETFEPSLTRSNERGYDLNTNSVQIGLDYRWNRRLVLGTLFDWRSSDLDFVRDSVAGAFDPTPDAGSVDTESIGGSLFASLELTRHARLDAAFGYLKSDYELERRATFEPVQVANPAPVTTVVSTVANSDGREWWATANWTYVTARDGWTMDPFLGATYTHSEIESYVEEDLSASGLAMRVDALDTSSLTGSMGIDVRRVASTAWAVLIPQLRVEYSYELDRDAVKAATSFLLGPDDNPLRLQGNDPDRDFLQLGAGLVAVFQHGRSLFIDARTTVGLDDVDRYVLAVGWRMEL